MTSHSSASDHVAFGPLSCRNIQPWEGSQTV
jgi:hypothetical protein